MLLPTGVVLLTIFCPPVGTGVCVGIVTFTQSLLAAAVALSPAHIAAALFAIS